MKKYLILITFLVVSTIVAQAKTIYSCFLSQDLNMKTSEVSNQVSNNDLITITVEGSTLKLGNSKTYSLFNKTASDKGFVHIVHYDAVDNQNQRCKIKIIQDSSADWVTRNAIVIWYDEISPMAKWYQSRDPQER